MSPKQVLTLAFFFLVTPPLAVYAWQMHVKQQELRNTPPHELPGSVVMLYTPGCGACVRMMPIVQELKNAGYRLSAIDINDQPGVGREYNVRAVPTFVYKLDGKEQFRAASMMSAGTLQDFCRGLRDSASLW